MTLPKYILLLLTVSSTFCFSQTVRFAREICDGNEDCHLDQLTTSASYTCEELESCEGLHLTLNTNFGKFEWTHQSSPTLESQASALDPCEEWRRSVANQFVIGRLNTSNPNKLSSIRTETLDW